jgi:hypothetical protein
VGIDRDDGEIEFTIDRDTSSVELQRVAAWFHFRDARTITVFGESFRFSKGESIRLFFSYRHTPSLMHSLLKEYSLEILDQWITPSNDEGVFLVKTLGETSQT